MRYLNFLLIFVPIAIIAQLLGWSTAIQFVSSALAVIPLASLMGEATESLATYTGPRIGGLLNATLGNAAELIITAFALRAGLLELVKASITGSILGNMLLVLGASLFFGGWRNGTQRFNRAQTGRNAVLLLLAVLALSVPSLFGVAIEQQSHQAVVHLSEGTAVTMIVLYALGLLYALRAPEETALTREPAPDKSMPSLRQALALLLAATIGIAIASEILVGSVESTITQFGLSEFFVGIIVVPIIGNVAEHIVGVEVALKNQMDLSLEISLGSGLQVALFVAPVLVYFSLVLSSGGPLTLVFNSFELIALFIGALTATFIALDGESNWLEGVMLLALYIILALAFFYLPQVSSGQASQLISPA